MYGATQLIVVSSISTVLLTAMALWLNRLSADVDTTNAKTIYSTSTSGQRVIDGNVIQAFQIAVLPPVGGTCTQLAIDAKLLDGERFGKALMALLDKVPQSTSEHVHLLMLNSVHFVVGVTVGSAVTTVDIASTGQLTLPGTPSMSSACNSDYANAIAWIYIA